MNARARKLSIFFCIELSGTRTLCHELGTPETADGQGAKPKPVVFSSQTRDGLNLTILRTLPKLAFVFHVVSRCLCDFAPVIPFHNVQGKIDPRAEASGGSNFVVVYVAESGHEMHRWVLLLHIVHEQVVGGRPLMVQKTVSGEHGGASANRHG